MEIRTKLMGGAECVEPVRGIEAAELIERLTIAAVELYSLGCEENGDEVGIFKEAIPLVAKAWELPDECAESALVTIGRQLEAIQNADADGRFELVMDEDSLLQTLGGAEILEALWALIQTTTRLDEREDREHLTGLIRYLTDFWNLADHISY